MLNLEKYLGKKLLEKRITKESSKFFAYLK